MPALNFLTDEREEWLRYLLLLDPSRAGLRSDTLGTSCDGAIS